MNLVKNVSLSTTLTNGGKIGFVRDGDELRLDVFDTQGALQDHASLSEADLRSIVKDLFPTKRAPKAATAAAVGNGTSRRRSAASASA